jgi:hypothetical protein
MDDVAERHDSQNNASLVGDFNPLSGQDGFALEVARHQARVFNGMIPRRGPVLKRGAHMVQVEVIPAPDVEVEHVHQHAIDLW